MFFGRAAVVHGEGVHIQRHVSAGQYAEVNGLAADLQTQGSGVDAVGQIHPSGCMRVYALAQGGRRGHGAQAQGTGKVGVLALDSMASKSFLPKHSRPS